MTVAAPDTAGVIDPLVCVCVCVCVRACDGVDVHIHHRRRKMLKVGGLNVQLRAKRVQIFMTTPIFARSRLLSR